MLTEDAHGAQSRTLSGAMTRLPDWRSALAYQRKTSGRSTPTFWLAERFGVSTQDLRALNPDVLAPRVGHMLCVPATNCPKGLVPYVVKPGETLAGLAARTRTSTRILLHLNQLGNSGEVEPGQVLCIPTFAGAPQRFSRTTKLGSRGGPKQRSGPKRRRTGG